LEQGKVIDLLPDRDADTLAEWLKAHPTIFDPYRAYVHQCWQEGCQNMAQIYREIKGLGFVGSYGTVYGFYRELE
jgi:transposase